MDVTPKSAGIENFGTIEFFSTSISNYLHVEGEGTEPITDDKLMSSP